eukprot:TRINITY_DN47940_c0_g1_i1.p1 TRINITY_DN47940_c0_g1~~TRINITY_DN47940_c0_g1_i1.p1  ORF type:complete len:534 (+),score=28.60 TRINITY_DN47940_c0_g1_i1:257-1858(+)
MTSHSSAAEAQSSAATPLCSHHSSNPVSLPPNRSSDHALKSPPPPAAEPSACSVTKGPHVPPLFFAPCNAIVSFSDALVCICGSSASSLGTDEPCCKDPWLSDQTCQHWAARIRHEVLEYHTATQGTSFTATSQRRSMIGIFRLGCLFVFVLLSFVLDRANLFTILLSVFLNLIFQDAAHSTALIARGFQYNDTVRGSGAVISTAHNMLYVYDNPRTLLHRVPISCVSGFRMSLVQWKVGKRENVQQVLNSQRCSYCVEIITTRKTILVGNCADGTSMASFVEEANNRLRALRECGRVQAMKVADMYGDDNPYCGTHLPVTSELWDVKALTVAQRSSPDIKVNRKENEWVKVCWYQPGEIHYLPPIWRWVHVVVLGAISLFWLFPMIDVKIVTIVYLIATMLPVNHNSISWRTLVCVARRGSFFGLDEIAFVLLRRHQVGVRDVASVTVNRLPIERMRRMHAKYSVSAVNGRRIELELKFKSGKATILKSLYPHEALIIAKELHRLCPALTENCPQSSETAGGADRDALLPEE